MNRDSKSLLKLAQKHGWQIVEIKGSHYTLRKEDLKLSTLERIAKAYERPLSYFVS